MGFSLKKVTRSVTKALNPAKAVKSALKSAGEIQSAAVGAVVKPTVDLIKGVGTVAKAGTQVVQENPALTGLAGTALGIPGLAGAFAGGSGGAIPTADPIPQAAPAAEPAKTPMWIWIVSGAGVLLVALLLFRKKT